MVIHCHVSERNGAGAVIRVCPTLEELLRDFSLSQICHAGQVLECKCLDYAMRVWLRGALGKGVRKAL